MVRFTLKYRKALQIAPDFPRTTNVQLYQYLFDQGYAWDEQQQEWVEFQTGDNDLPDRRISIRVMTDYQEVDAIAETIAGWAENAGYRLISRSRVYLCHPPNGNDGRVYLTLERRR